MAKSFIADVYIAVIGYIFICIIFVFPWTCSWCDTALSKINAFNSYSYHYKWRCSFDENIKIQFLL